MKWHCEGGRSVKSKYEKVVLACSGGLDTSVTVLWAKEDYDCEVITFTADLGRVPLVLAFATSDAD